MIEIVQRALPQGDTVLGGMTVAELIRVLFNSDVLTRSTIHVRGTGKVVGFTYGDDKLTLIAEG